MFQFPMSIGVTVHTHTLHLKDLIVSIESKSRMPTFLTLLLVSHFHLLVPIPFRFLSYVRDAYKKVIIYCYSFSSLVIYFVCCFLFYRQYFLTTQAEDHYFPFGSYMQVQIIFSTGEKYQGDLQV